MPSKTRNPISYSGLESAAVVRERVTQNERNIISLQAQIQDVQASMATQEDVRSLAVNVAALGTKLDTIGKPQWQAISVVVTVVVLIGGLVYWPIREKQYDQTIVLQRHENEIVPRVEHMREWERTDRLIQKNTDRVEELQKELWGRR